MSCRSWGCTRIFGSSSGASCTFCRLCSMVTKPALTLLTASIGITKWCSSKPRCPPGDMQEAHLPVGFVDKEVSDVADPIVVEIGDGTMDEVAWQKEDMCPLARCFHVRPPL